MSSKKASEEAMEELHGVLARILKTKINSDEVTASDLNVARQFLKDNGINSVGVKNPDVKSLADDLPDDLDDGNVTPLYGKS